VVPDVVESPYNDEESSITEEEEDERAEGEEMEQQERSAGEAALPKIPVVADVVESSSDDEESNSIEEAEKPGPEATDGDVPSGGQTAALAPHPARNPPGGRPEIQPAPSAATSSWQPSSSVSKEDVHAPPAPLNSDVHTCGQTARPERPTAPAAAGIAPRGALLRRQSRGEMFVAHALAAMANPQPMAAPERANGHGRVAAGETHMMPVLSQAVATEANTTSASGAAAPNSSQGAAKRKSPASEAPLNSSGRAAKGKGKAVTQVGHHRATPVKRKLAKAGSGRTSRAVKARRRSPGTPVASSGTPEQSPVPRDSYARPNYLMPYKPEPDEEYRFWRPYNVPEQCPRPLRQDMPPEGAEGSRVETSGGEGGKEVQGRAASQRPSQRGVRQSTPNLSTQSQEEPEMDAQTQLASMLDRMRARSAHRHGLRAGEDVPPQQPVPSRPRTVPARPAGGPSRVPAVRKQLHF